LIVSKHIVLTCVLAAMVLILGCENPAGAASGSDTLTLPGGTVNSIDTINGEYFIDYRGMGSEDQFEAEHEKFRPFTVTAGVVPSITLTLVDIESRLRSSAERGNGMEIDVNYVFDGDDEITIFPQVNMIRIVQLTDGSGNLIRSNNTYNSNNNGTMVIEWWYVDKATSINGDFTSSPTGNNTNVVTATNLQLERGWNTIIITRGASTWTATSGSEPAGLSWYRG
jgi:hypothetical protein